jgi:hypothetical protein
MQNCERMIEARVESACGRFYQIADRLISVETDVEWTTRLVETFLSGFHVSPSLGHNSLQPHLRLKITTDPPRPLPTELQRFNVPGGVCYRNHQSYYLEVKGSRVEVGSKDSKQVEVWLGDSPQARTTRSLITVLAYAMPAALRRVGLYDLHAAALIEPMTACCFVFPGTSRSGKTTLSLRLAASGWRYLSDDAVVISEGEKAVEVRGLRRPFQTSSDSLGGCELSGLDDALGVTIPNDPEKRRLDPEILFPGQFAASAEPRVLCFPVITRQNESLLVETTKSEAMIRLIFMCPWSNYDASAARDHLGVLARLVRQCKTYTLQAGRDIFEQHTGASALLARIVKSS